jgi:hypothetical protein
MWWGGQRLTLVIDLSTRTHQRGYLPADRATWRRHAGTGAGLAHDRGRGGAGAGGPRRGRSAAEPGSGDGSRRVVGTDPGHGSADGTSASGLSLTGRVALPGRPAAVAVGEGAVWVLLEQGTLLRVDPTRHQVTGSMDLGRPGGGQVFGLVTAGQDAVWVGGGAVNLRVDPVRLRVTDRFGGSALDHSALLAAGGALWSHCCQREGKVLGLGRTDTRTLRPATPLVLVDESGRQKPVGRFAVAADAVCVEGGRDERLWRMPLAGGRAHAVRMPGFTQGIFGVAVGEGAVWVLRVRVAPGPTRRAGCCAWTRAAVSPRPRRCRSCSLTRRSGRSSAGTPSG